jgi:prepilin-type N-terminal cleavage/methylation domain-containing protein
MHSSSRRGFTLIELLIVVVIIGILATFAVIQMRSSKDKAVVSTMAADLHAINLEQEAYFVQNRTYTTDLGLLNVVLSPANAATVVEATATGWSGRMTNPRVSKTCVIVVGNAVMIGGATTEGAITCQ